MSAKHQHFITLILIVPKRPRVIESKIPRLPKRDFQVYAAHVFSGSARKTNVEQEDRTQTLQTVNSHHDK